MITSCLVWDESEQRMVEIYRTAKYTVKQYVVCYPGQFVTTDIFYHPWERRKYTEEQLKTEPLPSFGPKCTCGVKFTGGLCSDWCDTKQPIPEDDYEFPF